MYLYVKLEILKSLPKFFYVGYAVFSYDGSFVYQTTSLDVDDHLWPKYSLGINIIKGQIPSRLLNEGLYKIVFIAGIYFERYIFNPEGDSPYISLEIQGGFSESTVFKFKRKGLLAPIILWQTVFK